MRNVGLVLLLLLLVGHNVLMAISLIPANPLSIRYANEALDYTNKISPQGWFFFTPVPTRSYTVEVRFGENEGVFGAWSDPFLETIHQHRKNPFGLAEKESYIHMDFAKAVADAVLADRKDNLALWPPLTKARLHNFLAFHAGGHKLAQWRVKEWLVPPFSQRHERKLLQEKELLGENNYVTELLSAHVH